MEDAYVITGGKPLEGYVKLSGAKNVALKLIIAALQFSSTVTLENVPKINDVLELIHLIRLLGAKAEFVESNTLHIDSRNLSSHKVDLLHGSKIRVSFMLFSPLLHKFRECFVPNPGGCRIGARPIDRIVEGMKSLGVTLEYDTTTGYYNARMPRDPSGNYHFAKPSHTGTELLVLLGSVGTNTIHIENAALEPEIDELIHFLNESGARIQRDGHNIVIHGVSELKQKLPFEIQSDRNEAVTFATLAIASKGNIAISPIQEQPLKTFLDKLKHIGAGVEVGKQQMRFYNKNPIASLNVETSPHPGFMTDWQPNWAILMTQAKGESIIHERVFENRFSYVEELRKLGAEIDFIKTPIQNPTDFFFFNFDPAKKYNQAIKIKGPQQLHGGVLTVSDLRAGATLAIAALIAEGESVINGVSILERGYENFVEKIKSVGGEIEKI